MKKVVVLLAASIFLFAQCSKEKVGPKGDDGAPGVNGNANVISSGWFTVNNSDWEYQFDGISIAEIDEPLLTEEIIENSAIMVYVEIGAWNNEVFPLPTNHYYATSFYIKDPKVLTIQIQGAGAESLKTYRYRYVIIPANKMPVGLDINNYKEVSSTFKLD